MKTLITLDSYDKLTRICGVQPKSLNDLELYGIFRYQRGCEPSDGNSTYNYIVIKNAGYSFAVGEFTAYKSLAEILEEYNEI